MGSNLIAEYAVLEKETVPRLYRNRTLLSQFMLRHHYSTCDGPIGSSTEIQGAQKIVSSGVRDRAVFIFFE